MQRLDLLKITDLTKFKQFVYKTTTKFCLSTVMRSFKQNNQSWNPLKTLGGVALLVNCEKSLQNSIKWPDYMFVTEYVAKIMSKFYAQWCNLSNKTIRAVIHWRLWEE